MTYTLVLATGHMCNDTIARIIDKRSVAFTRYRCDETGEFAGYALWICFQEEFTFIIVGDSFICTKVCIIATRGQLYAVCIEACIYDCTIMAHLDISRREQTRTHL